VRPSVEANGVQITERPYAARVPKLQATVRSHSTIQTSKPSFPRPESGKLYININGLVDKLIQMGLIPEDQAMMPRMMLGMFATPVGDDMLTSTIEVNAEITFSPMGNVFARAI
jgi:hypothetical protein